MVECGIKLEKSLWKRGYISVVGLDEAGRGPWAGPVSAGGVMITPKTKILDRVQDSKKMSEKIREEVYSELKDSLEYYSVALISAEQIDNFGINSSVKFAMEGVIRNIEEILNKSIEYLIIDGSNCLDVFDYPSKKINSGDLKHYSISAASILAKVDRDSIMKKFAKKYPEYGFERHKGYGTKFHREMIIKHGPCLIHRLSYKPIAKIIKESTYEQKRDWKYWGEVSAVLAKRA